MMRELAVRLRDSAASYCFLAKADRNVATALALSTSTALMYSTPSLICFLARLFWKDIVLKREILSSCRLVLL